MELRKKIFTPGFDFESTALEIFHLQAKENPVYHDYLRQLKSDTSKIISIPQIPFLPVQFFKTREVITNNISSLKNKHSSIFTSSGTTGTETSRHFVTDTGLYETSFLSCFELFYGNLKDYCLLALLPSYLEREGSSLIYMARELIQRTENPVSGFYLDEFETLAETIKKISDEDQKIILLGVTYALLDFADYFKKNYSYPFPGVVMETGGMKGKRKEMVREEVHACLCNDFRVNEIHSEYGMTELLSQAYSKGNGIFQCPPWMKILIRDVNDPMGIELNEKTGGINIIDLANMDSCSFIATQDLGKKFSDGRFEVLGRFDDSDLRGCNLLVE